MSLVITASLIRALAVSKVNRHFYFREEGGMSQAISV